MVLLVDMGVGLQDSDRLLVEMLTETHRPFLVVLTKADRVKDALVAEKLEAVGNAIKTQGSLCVPTIHAVSS